MSVRFRQFTDVNVDSTVSHRSTFDDNAEIEKGECARVYTRRRATLDRGWIRAAQRARNAGPSPSAFRPSAPRTSIRSPSSRVSQRGEDVGRGRGTFLDVRTDVDGRFVQESHGVVWNVRGGCELRSAGERILVSDGASRPTETRVYMCVCVCIS